MNVRFSILPDRNSSACISRDHIDHTDHSYMSNSTVSKYKDIHVI